MRGTLGICFFLVNRLQDTHHLGLGDDDVIHQRLTMVFPDAPEYPVYPDLEDQLIAGGYRFLEASLVDAGKVINGVITRFLSHGLEGKYGSRLCHCFDNQYARHNRVLRKMARKKRSEEHTSE